MPDTDILLVGGGIAGTSAAYHLAAHGRRVTLLERGEIASGASGVNAGAIDSIGWGDRPDLQAHLTAGSVDIFKAVQLDHGEDIEFRQSGALQTIHTAEQYEFERARIQALRARGHQVELLAPRDVLSLEPGVLATPTLAEIYMDQGLTDKAALVYREILKGDPGNAEALARLADIERAQEPPADPRAESARRRIQALGTWLEAIRGGSRA